jgi:hypothetical protein
VDDPRHQSLAGAGLAEDQYRREPARRSLALDEALDRFPDGDDPLLQLCVQDPTFGLYLMRLVVQRLLDNERRWAAKAACDTRPR